MTIIEVNIQDAATKRSSLVEAVQKNGTLVRIYRDGNPVADLRSTSHAENPLLQDAKLASVRFNEDPMLPLGEDYWPTDLR